MPFCCDAASFVLSRLDKGQNLMALFVALLDAATGKIRLRLMPVAWLFQQGRTRS